MARICTGNTGNSIKNHGVLLMAALVGVALSPFSSALATTGIQSQGTDLPFSVGGSSIMTLTGSGLTMDSGKNLTLTGAGYISAPQASFTAVDFGSGFRFTGASGTFDVNSLRNILALQAAPICATGQLLSKTGEAAYSCASFSELKDASGAMLGVATVPSCGGTQGTTSDGHGFSCRSVAPATPACGGAGSLLTSDGAGGFTCTTVVASGGIDGTAIKPTTVTASGSGSFDGDMVIKGNLTVGTTGASPTNYIRVHGDEKVDGLLSVGGGAFAANAAGFSALAGNIGSGGLNVSGAVSTGALTSSSVSTSSVTSSGAILGGSLATTPGGTLNVSGASTLSGAVTTGALTSSSVSSTGAISGSSLATTPGGTLNVSGASTLGAVTAGATAVSSLTVGGKPITAPANCTGNNVLQYDTSSNTYNCKDVSTIAGTGGSGTFSAAPNGYTTLPGGIVLQWGTVVVPHCGGNVCYASISFSPWMDVYSVTGTPSFQDWGDSSAQMTFGLVSTTKSGAVVGFDHHNRNIDIDGKFYWQAIGKALAGGDGVCGSADKNPATSEPSGAALCNPGSVAGLTSHYTPGTAGYYTTTCGEACSSVWTEGTPETFQWTWSCTGSGGSAKTASCSTNVTNGSIPTTPDPGGGGGP